MDTRFEKQIHSKLTSSVRDIVSKEVLIIIIIIIITLSTEVSVETHFIKMESVDISNMTWQEMNITHS